MTCAQIRTRLDDYFVSRRPEALAALRPHLDGCVACSAYMEKLFAAEGDNVYEGQLVGIHSKDNDLTVNAIKPKPLTNMRASGKDDAIQLSPAIKFTLEQALDFIDDDELVEITPKEIRLRKKLLTESERKRASRAA